VIDTDAGLIVSIGPAGPPMSANAATPAKLIGLSFCFPLLFALDF
jgi:hypothetical protein